MGIEITKLEFAVLRAIDNSEYGGYLNDAVWTFSIADNIGGEVAPRSIPGIVSSLNKKGLVKSNNWGNGEDESTVGITKLGAEVYLAACAAAGVEPNKKVDSEG